jgi:hypothetical protein
LTLSVEPAIVVINGASAAFNLLERAAFSSKPKWTMAKLLGRQNNIGFTPYGTRLRAARKLLHADLNPNVVRNHWTLMADMSLSLMKTFMESPDSCYENVIRVSQDLIVNFTYGHFPDEKYTQLARHVMHETGVALQPGRWAVDRYPFRTLRSCQAFNPDH